MRATILSFGTLRRFLPIAVCRFRKARHRPANVLFGNFTFALANQIDDALVRLQIAVPGRGVLFAGDDTNAGECEKWQQNAAGMLDQVRISRNPA